MELLVKHLVECKFWLFCNVLLHLTKKVIKQVVITLIDVSSRHLSLHEVLFLGQGDHIIVSDTKIREPLCVWLELGVLEEETLLHDWNGCLHFDKTL